MEFIFTTENLIYRPVSLGNSTERVSNDLIVDTIKDKLIIDIKHNETEPVCLVDLKFTALIKQASVAINFAGKSACSILL